MILQPSFMTPDLVTHMELETFSSLVHIPRELAISKPNYLSQTMLVLGVVNLLLVLLM